MIVPLIKTPEEWNNLLQTIFRTPSIDVYLKIEQGEDINQLAEYWGNFGRANSIRPILKRISNTPGGGKIDIAKLLPSIPKSRLHTFTGIDETDKHPRDCIWTVMNFFNDQPDERYTIDDSFNTYFQQIASTLTDKSQLKFGDMIFIADKNENSIHGCIYIADNIVYTKNGQNSTINITPFSLSYYDRTLALYSANRENVNTRYFSRLIADTNKIK